MSPTFTSPDIVVAPLEAIDGEGAIRELHAALIKACPADVTNPDALLATALERQSVSSTALDAEVALPHARTDAVKRILFAIGVSEKGVSFDAEHPHIKLVFYVGTPVGCVSEYLRFVSGLTRRLRAPGVRAALLAATGDHDVRAALDA